MVPHNEFDPFNPFFMDAVDRHMKRTYLEDGPMPYQCRIYPAKSGNYVKVEIRGVHYGLHRLVAARYCVRRALLPYEMIDHLCQNKRCVNPGHLKVTDGSGNAKTRVEAYNFYGENHPQAKLTEEEVFEIRLRYAQGETQRDIALEYGAYQSNVSAMVLGKKWKHSFKQHQIRIRAITGGI